MKILPKLKKFIKSNQQDIVLIIAIVLITIISFNAGRIYGTANLKSSIRVIKGGSTNPEYNNQPINQKVIINKTDLRVVASKSSLSKKYHFLWCPGAEKIKESNRIYFNSESEAQSRGYLLAGNCQK